MSSIFPRSDALSTPQMPPGRIGRMAVAFPDALRRFDAHLQAIGRAVKTRSTYRYELTRFWCDWCAVNDLDILEASEADVEAYLASLSVRGSKRGDASRALKAFYGWAEGRLASLNPASRVHIPRGRAGTAPSLPEADVRRLLRAAFRRDPHHGWAIMLCLATGARIGSLVALRASDIDFERSWVQFRVTKGDRPYGLPMNRQALCAARHLISANRPTLLGVGAPGFRVWVHQAERDGGLDRVWPHLLRHEFSNRVAAKGDPEAWRQALNHSDLSQWARYVAANDDRLRAVVS